MEVINSADTLPVRMGHSEFEKNLQIFINKIDTIEDSTNKANLLHILKQVKQSIDNKRKDFTNSNWNTEKSKLKKFILQQRVFKKEIIGERSRALLFGRKQIIIEGTNHNITKTEVAMNLYEKIHALKVMKRVREFNEADQVIYNRTIGQTHLEYDKKIIYLSRTQGITKPEYEDLKKLKMFYKYRHSNDVGTAHDMTSPYVGKIDLYFEFIPPAIQRGSAEVKPIYHRLDYKRGLQNIKRDVGLAEQLTELDKSKIQEYNTRIQEDLDETKYYFNENTFEIKEDNDTNDSGFKSCTVDYIRTKFDEKLSETQKLVDEETKVKSENDDNHKLLEVLVEKQKGVQTSFEENKSILQKLKDVGIRIESSSHQSSSQIFGVTINNSTDKSIKRMFETMTLSDSNIKDVNAFLKWVEANEKLNPLFNFVKKEMGFNESKIIELFQSLNRQNEKIGELQVAEALKDIFNEALYNFNSIRSDIPNYRVDDVPFEFKEQKSEELIKKYRI